jgi:hypothetical protein
MVGGETEDNPKRPQGHARAKHTPLGTRLGQKRKDKNVDAWKPQAGFEPTTFRLLSECSTPKLLWHAP